MSGKGLLQESMPQLGPVHTVLVRDTVASAAVFMRDKGVGCLVVLGESGEPISILSERDIVTKVTLPGRTAEATVVGDVMSSPVVSCTPRTPMTQVRRLMVRHKVRHVPVISQGRAVGIVSARDLMVQELNNDRAMRCAAEQAAMLSTCLRSLDLDEVVSLVSQEVPRMFQAERCVFFLQGAENGRPGRTLITRHNCPASERDLRLAQKQLAGRTDQGIHVARTPMACRAGGCNGQMIAIPLKVAGLGECPADSSGGAERDGCLCMCQMKMDLPKELIWYKAALVRNIVSSHLTNARLYEEARRTSSTDPLTGIGNRRYFDELIEAECARAKRYGQAFCVAIVDLDHFKQINDRLGHTAGDEALRKLATIMKHAKRDTDILARYGGDEFILMLPQTPLEGSLSLLERIRHQASKISMPKDLQVTLSCGVAEHSGQEGDSSNELIRRADMALYEAKHDGRDRIKTWKQIACRLEDGAFFESQRVKELQNQVAGMSMQSKDMFLQSIYGLIQAIEARDPYTRSHSENVMRYSIALGEAMGINPGELEVIHRSAMVHDLGKIGIPDAILRKPARLTSDERAVMEQHPAIAVKIMGQMRFLQREMGIVRHHHERWDGTGYPDGLSGKQIPQGARILSVADAFDAITSDRVYHRSRSVGQAIEVLAAESGKQFDPDVVAAMMRWIDANRRQTGTVDLTARDLLAIRSSFAA